MGRRPVNSRCDVRRQEDIHDLNILSILYCIGLNICIKIPTPWALHVASSCDAHAAHAAHAACRSQQVKAWHEEVKSGRFDYNNFRHPTRFHVVNKNTRDLELTQLYNIERWIDRHREVRDIVNAPQGSPSHHEDRGAHSGW